MLPSIFGENLFDDFFGNDFGFFPAWNEHSPLYGKHAKNLMKTDVRETDECYELDVDLPGFQKDEIHVDLKDGYLTIRAAKGLDKDTQDKKGKYIRQERYAGACSRSFYVGDVESKDVSAKYENGILTLSLPKQVKKALPASTSSAIGYLRKEARAVWHGLLFDGLQINKGRPPCDAAAGRTAIFFFSSALIPPDTYAAWPAQRPDPPALPQRSSRSCRPEAWW